jgi:hypothetical protein
VKVDTDTEIPLIDEVRSFRQRVAERLQELEPLVREYNELKQVAAEIGLVDAVGEMAPARGLAAAEAGTERRGRARSPRGHDDRQAASTELGNRVLEAVRADPGKTVADYAAILDLSATTLYRPVRELTTDGTLVKRARHLFPS